MELIASSHKIAIVGVGVTGLSVARFLRAQQKSFVLMDSRETPPNLDVIHAEFADVECFFGDLDVAVLLQVDEIVLSPGVSLKTPEIATAVQAGISVIGDIELFVRTTQKPIVAITGSNAKSTVTTLVGEMAKAAGVKVAVGGNLGEPVLSLLRDDKSIELYVLELSSFQLETTHSLAAQAATVLNVSHDHMDRYDSFADYHLAKQRIYHRASTLVINRDDPLTHPPIAQAAKVISFGQGQSDLQGFGLMQIDGKEQLAFQFKPLIAVEDLLLAGRHNVVNALAALALGYAAGLTIESMLQALKQFKGLPHRCEFVRSLNQVDYINDSKATNVGATLAALEGFSNRDGKIVLIAGGQGKDADFSPLFNALQKTVRLLVLLGEDAQALADVAGSEIPHCFESSIEAAVETAHKHAEAGDIVLLSPACASFDMFSGFAQRGECFARAVKGLAA